MKISKKIIALILIILCLTIAYTYLSISNEKYVLTNIEPTKIDCIEIFHDNNSFNYPIDNSKCTDILKYVKSITKQGNFNNVGNSIAFDSNFPKHTANNNPNDYFIKINFTSNTEVSLNNTCITCRYIIFDINNSVLYYWIQASSTINTMSIENTDLSKLKEYICNNI
ncbi:MAG: hypothetical protein E7213_03430 [Clostridium sp.]|nr:hypothetical protein [Clostridium sp.]